MDLLFLHHVMSCGDGRLHIVLKEIDLCLCCIWKWLFVKLRTMNFKKGNYLSEKTIFEIFNNNPKQQKKHHANNFVHNIINDVIVFYTTNFENEIDDDAAHDEHKINHAFEVIIAINTSNLTNYKNSIA